MRQNYFKKFLSITNYYNILNYGDWGLGIGPIPNPQSPIPIKIEFLIIYY